MKFKVKRTWWIWALVILLHVLAMGFLKFHMTYIFFIIMIIDIAVILPEIHVSYDITNRQFTMKRALFGDISFPCDKIQSVEDATLLTMGGRFGNQIYGESLGAIKITYIDKIGIIKRKGLVISPKDKTAFLSELGLHVDPEVIWIGNPESAFKKKKDKG